MYTLTREQAVELVEAAREGDRDAWADLVDACSGFARKLAASRAGSDDALFDDLYQVAAGDGLWAAIETWDPERGEFGSWAWQKMNAAVWGEVRGERPVELALDGMVEVEGEPQRLDEVLPDEQPLPDEICIGGECAVALRAALAQAAESERDVAIAGGRLLAEEPMGLSELGDLLGLSPQRVGQVEGELLERVREIVTDDEEE